MVVGLVQKEMVGNPGLHQPTTHDGSSIHTCLLSEFARENQH